MKLATSDASETITLSHHCPACGGRTRSPLAKHIKREHGEEALKKALVEDKRAGLSDPQIGAKYGVSFRYLERAVTEATGTNVSVLSQPKRVTRWEPNDFQPETTTVWSFKSRGNWATHDGRYRGNWSPYIPRNLILRYSKPAELVLDPFAGGGTSAVEAKLLGRQCITRDINPDAVKMTLANLEFAVPASLFAGPVLYEPDVATGDARNLTGIPKNSVDLICAHPPYAGIIGYSADVEADLSTLSHEAYLQAMRGVADECFRVLKPGRHCGILIGDTRQKKRVVPMGFQVVRLFLDAGFRLKELIIKRQHNCKTTGFWYANSIKWNFLLLAHEFLPVFEKPLSSGVAEPRPHWRVVLPQAMFFERVKRVEREKLETMTVWLFPPDEVDGEVRRNLLARFGIPEGFTAEICLGGERTQIDTSKLASSRLAIVRFPNESKTWREQDVSRYIGTVTRLANDAAAALPDTAALVIEIRDVRVNGYVEPVALLGYEALRAMPRLALREIVVVVPEGAEGKPPDDGLAIVHRYLLVFTCHSSQGGI